MSTSSPVSDGKNTSNPRVVIASLLAVIAILIVVIALLFFNGGAPQAAPAMPSGNAGMASGSQSAAQSATPQSAAPEFAPSYPDPKGLEIIRKQPRRDAADGQAKGNVDAKVVMTVYSDFACPYCTLLARDVTPELQDLIDDGTLRIEWRDLAQIHPTSPLAAQAGRAAAEQGKFWEFHDVVYKAADPNEHPEYSEEKLIDFATQAGVPDIEKFRATMNAQETVDAVKTAQQDAYKIGVQGTPFIFIGDAVINGYAKSDYVRRTVTEQAKLVTK
ncbi:MAG: DsbA family protein [Actinomycetaceae bacterium]|nr:DsbA family protein [Actinomycetaceae bacterium]